MCGTMNSHYALGIVYGELLILGLRTPDSVWWFSVHTSCEGSGHRGNSTDSSPVRQAMEVGCSCRSGLESLRRKSTNIPRPLPTSSRSVQSLGSIMFVQKFCRPFYFPGSRLYKTSLRRTPSRWLQPQGSYLPFSKYGLRLLRRSRRGMTLLQQLQSSLTMTFVNVSIVP